MSGRAAARAASSPVRAASTPVRGPQQRTAARGSGRPELRLLPSTPVPSARGRRTAPARRPSSRKAPFVLLVVALLVGTTLGLLILNTAIAVDSLKATQLRAANAHRAQEVQRLEQQVISADAPARLAAAARSRGLVPAGTPGYLVLGRDGHATLRGTPAPAGNPAAAGSDGG